MERRQIIKYGGISLLSAMAATWTARTTAQTSPLRVQWLGHTCFLFTGDGLRILVNPYRNLGCTAGYSLPDLEPDLVLISSRLLDEGAIDKFQDSSRILFEPGLFNILGFQFQGVALDHDREGGRRFGTNVAWSWTQGGIKIVHLGGAASKIDLEQKILLGRPDLALVPVGAGDRVPKAYNPTDAVQAIKVLDPKVVIPTHYLTEAAEDNTCDLLPVDAFLQLVDVSNVKRLDQDTITIRPEDLPSSLVIRVLSDGSVLQS